MAYPLLSNQILLANPLFGYQIIYSQPSISISDLLGQAIIIIIYNVAFPVLWYQIYLANPLVKYQIIWPSLYPCIRYCVSHPLLSNQILLANPLFRYQIIYSQPSIPTSDLLGQAIIIIIYNVAFPVLWYQIYLANPLVKYQIIWPSLYPHIIYCGLFWIIKSDPAGWSTIQISDYMANSLCLHQILLAKLLYPYQAIWPFLYYQIRSG